MPCPHKFREYLNLDNLDFEPTTLIVGTFNPAWPETNLAHWFYGRTGNNHFWEVLPRLYGKESLLQAEPAAWKQFCAEHKIAITDLIACIVDADENSDVDKARIGGYTDDAITSYKQHELVDIRIILSRYPSIKQVYLTRSIGDTFWRRAWKPIQKYCIENDIRDKTLMTPSGNAYRQQGKYNRANPDAKLSISDFIIMRWQEKWHKLDQ